MDFVSRYVSHQPDDQGMVSYSTAEHDVWRKLFLRQQELLPGRACDAFLQGLNCLALTPDVIPQLPGVNQRLRRISGWQVVSVPALISARHFFELLAQRQFPAATFIRSLDELDYVTEPDIFHELFGHCPMLTDVTYADFIYHFACHVLKSPEMDWPLLQRLFWFTVEFGLIQTAEGLRAYGGGILSSITETVYSVESHVPMRVLFDPVVAWRMPYRIDQLQPVYFVIQDYDALYALVTSDMSPMLKRARELGEYPPFFHVDAHNPNIHIHAC